MTGLETLPVELLQLIFSYSLPGPLPVLAAAAFDSPSALLSSNAAASSACSWSTFPTRSTRLRTYSLLSRSWSEWGRRELARHVVLRTADQVRLFLRQRPNAHSTETLRIGGVERNGRLLDASRLREVVDRVRGVRQVWLVQVENADLRDLRDLQDLRTLICVSVSVSFSSSSAQQPVPSVPPCFPHLHTLVLHQIHLSPFIRTILYESHSFDQLRVLAFDSAEVVEQIFDSDPEGMPRLIAMRPGHDLQFEYYTALDAAQDDSTQDEDVCEEQDASERRQRTGLVSLSASSNFLSCFEHYAPWLPDAVRRLSIDLGGGSDAALLPTSMRSWLDPGVDAFVTAANRAAAARRARSTVVRLGVEDDDGEVDTTAFDVDLFLEQVDEIVLPVDWLLHEADSREAVLDRMQMPDEVFGCFERLRTEYSVKLVPPPRLVVRLEEDDAEGLAAQDTLIPWRFLVEARDTLEMVASGGTDST